MAHQWRPLSTFEHSQLAPYFKSATLATARIIEHSTPFWLRPSMCAVVVRSNIYFRKGAYQAKTKQGLALLAHELTHVEQYLAGMTIVKYLWASRKGYKKNHYEIEAYAKGEQVYQALSKQVSLKIGIDDQLLNM